MLAAVRGDPSLASLDDKSLKQAVLPFAKFKMEEAVKGGAQVLDTKLPFDEKQLLTDNLAYLVRSLKLEALAVHGVGDAAAAAAVPPTIDLKAACPGAPITYFATAAAEPPAS